MKRVISMIFAAVMALTALSGCRKGGSESVTGTDLTAGDRGTLTGIYEATPLALPDGFELADTAQIGTDPEAGEILVLAQRGKEIEEEDGTVAYLADLCLIAYDGSGAKVREVPLEDAKNSLPRVAAVSRDRVWAFCDLTQSSSGRLLEWDASSGALLSQTEAKSIKGWAGQTSPRKLIADTNGNLWLSDGAKVVVISPERVWINQFKLNALDMAALRDGSVRAVSNLASGRGIARLDPETGRYEDAVALWDNAVNAVPGGPEDEYLFYYNGESGICGVRTDEEGKPVSDELMSFVNSNVNYNASLVPSEDTLQLSAALSAEAFVMTEWSRGSDGWFRFLPVLYRREEDLELSAVKEIQIAHWNALPKNLAWEITQFNKAHTDIRVTMLDYTKYNSDEDRRAGAKQLTLDVITGIVSPDILMGSTAEGPLLEMQKHGIALDLTPYLKDAGLDGDLFGCVRTSFTDGEGKLWGICPTFSLNFFASSQERLGALGEKGRWTTAEFMDFVEALPEDCALHPYSTSDTRGDLGPDFNAFIDRETASCSFDSPLFYRYLRWLETLPTGEEWWSGEGESHGLNKWPIAPYLHSGKLALRGSGMSDVQSVIMEDIHTTGGKDYALIGEPSETGSGVELMSDTGMAILTGSKHPEACWEFIRACLEEPILLDSDRWQGQGCGLPALKSIYDKEMEMLTQIPIAKFVSNASFCTFKGIRDLDFVQQESEKMAHGTPWYLEPYDEEELSYLRGFIDSAGEPFTGAFPWEISQIMSEEINEYLAGMGTPEDCAKKIQSRASIWLAEHK
ncbi:MAG: extracellular solute-binding protein [Clostridia bacterium]|nr:extracellular solute-binding protein [Clostridia bacterium]